MKRIRSIYYLLQATKYALQRLRKAIINSSDRDLVLGIAELALNVQKGNCKISKTGVDQLRKLKIFLRRLVDKGIALGRKKKLIVQRDGFLLPLITAVLSALPSPYYYKNKLRKILLLSPEYFEQLRRYDDENDIDTEARNEWRRLRSLLKKWNAHPHNKWIKLRVVQDPLLKGAPKNRRPITLPIYGTEVGTPSRSRHVDTGIQTKESDRVIDVYKDEKVGSSFVGD